MDMVLRVMLSFISRSYHDLDNQGVGTENHDGIVSEIGGQGKFFQDFCYQDDHQGPANPAGIFDPDGSR